MTRCLDSGERYRYCPFQTVHNTLTSYSNTSSFVQMKQEGEKPSQIISAELDIGASIQQNASNGNTNVLINGREITKTELWMLQVRVLDRPNFLKSLSSDV